MKQTQMFPQNNQGQEDTVSKCFSLDKHHLGFNVKVFYESEAEPRTVLLAIRNGNGESDVEVG